MKRNSVSLRCSLNVSLRIPWNWASRCLGFAPERLDAVDVSAALDEFVVALIDPKMLLQAQINQPIVTSPTIGVRLLGSTLPRMMACSVALEALGTVLVWTQSPRPRRPKTMVLPPAPRPRLPRIRLGLSRNHRPQARLRMKTERHIPEPDGHGYAGTPH